ncbi:hypothetical protein PMAYCL1PPCAC_20731, partial [Pristionchus mayeri]
DANVHRVMELAKRFKLKIVEDRVVPFLLSDASTLPFQKKLVFAERYNITFLKNILLSHCTEQSLSKLGEWEDVESLSYHTLRILFFNGCSFKSQEIKESTYGFNIYVEKWKKGQVEQLSVNYPVFNCLWQLRLYKGSFKGKRLEMI